MPKPSRVIVVAEDQRHQSFIRRYLRRLGYTFHDVYFEDLPSGRGCGEQWVREHYARAVAAYRARCAHAQTALVVTIDADNGDVGRRLQQLQSALTGASLVARGPTEKIAHLIPKRNIETWILCLHGDPVDETTDYRHDQRIGQIIGPAAETFFQWSRTNFQVPSHCVPSLLSAIPEVRRLE